MPNISKKLSDFFNALFSPSTQPEEPTTAQEKQQSPLNQTHADSSALNRATLRLFRGVWAEHSAPQAISDTLLARALAHGYVLAPNIFATPKLLDIIEQTVISAEQANQTFHKSWATVANTDMERLVTQQLMHYVSTYGVEALLGEYDAMEISSQVYIPYEALDIPALKNDIPLIAIHALSTNVLRDKIIALGGGIALAKQTLEDIMVIVHHVRFEPFADLIKNRELSVRLHEFYGTAPQEPEAYLRYLVYQLTGETLLIKNKALITKLKACSDKQLAPLLRNAPDDLASIFLRYKPLFLAMKANSRAHRTFFNRLRKQAKRLHKPLPTDYLNSVTAQIKAQTLDVNELQKRLEKATIYRKIRLANALAYRLHAPNAIVYRVRHGRSWASEFAWEDKHQALLTTALECVKNAIADDLRERVAGKTFYIPRHVRYALPATEKQFTGNFPTGSWVSVPEDLIVGIHWTNTEQRRVDLDLSLINLRGQKVGWNADYRNDERSLLFSGDMTDAPKPQGATELFYIKKTLSEPQALLVNDFNFCKGEALSCQILVAKESPKHFGENYMVDPNHIVMRTEITMENRQNLLGLINCVDGENRVYFANINIGNSIVSSHRADTQQAQTYLMHSVTQTLMLDEMLTRAGAVVVDTPADLPVCSEPEQAVPMENREYIDLSPEQVDKTTFIALLSGNHEPEK